MNTRLTGMTEVRKLARHGQKVVHFVLCAILAGCATLPATPTEPARKDWGTLVVAPALYPPKSNIRSFAVGKGTGAAKGAAVGSTIGFSAMWMAAAATGGPFAVVFAPYLAVITATAEGAAGAYTGSQAAISEQDVATMEGRIQDNLTLLQIPRTLAQAIVDTANQDTRQQLLLLAEAGRTSPEATPDYPALAQQRADSVLEVVASDVGFTANGKQLSFYLVANVRVVRVSDGGQLYQREFVYQSDEHDVAQWGENNAALFQAEWQHAYVTLAESVVEQVFLLTPLPAESRAKATGEPGIKDVLGGGLDACGLAWVSPEHDYRPAINDKTHRTWNRFPKVTSLQPNLAWEAFPRDKDKHADAKNILSGISNVLYDVRVWQAENDAPPKLVYERRDLPTPTHTMAQSLLPGTRYFWSARSRFDMDGKTHSTKWGYFRSPNYITGGKINPEPSPGAVIQAGIAGVVVRDVCTLDFIPTSNYYRFQTP